MKQKGSSDVKYGSLWKHSDKKVLLWHREAPCMRLFITLIHSVLKMLHVGSTEIRFLQFKAKNCLEGHEEE